MELSRAVDDGTDTFGLDDGPDKERNTSDGYDNRFGGEKVAAANDSKVSGCCMRQAEGHRHFVNGEPNGWQRDKPE